jgi:hypothetical protein
MAIGSTRYNIMPDKTDSPEIVMGKVSSSKIPGFHLIPTEALVRLALRFDVGVERKKELAWNALTANQDMLTNKEFILHRIGHVINHAQKLRDKIVAGTSDLGDDDAGAIIWAGAFLCCATKALEGKHDGSR